MPAIASKLKRTAPFSLLVEPVETGRRAGDEVNTTSLHVSDGTKKFATLETKTIENGEQITNPVTVTRYQYDNHLGSACLELDEDAAIISYEEYHPFGTTSYRSGSSETEVSLKRYKYVGKERDEETGLYYYGARYYAGWIARFVSVDPLQHKYPYLTPYNYAGNKPITHIDIDGMQGTGDKPEEKLLLPEQMERRDASLTTSPINTNLESVNSIIGNRNSEYGPSEAEAAALSAHVYGDKRDDILIGGWKVSDLKIDNVVYNDPKTGLKSQLYERTILDGKHKGETEYVYAIAGTEKGDKRDIVEDIELNLGSSAQCQRATNNAIKINEFLGSKVGLTFTGHSLGGAEAALSAYATNRNAITFNAAGLSETAIKTYTGIDTKSSPTKIEAYIWKTDPLNILQKQFAIPTANGSKHYRMDYSNTGLINGHSIDNFLRINKINPSFYQRHVHNTSGSW